MPVIKQKSVLNLGRVHNKPIERTNALTLIMDSHQFFEYYQRGKSGKEFSKVDYFLLLRSLETGLKALLKLKEGITVEELKNKKTFGHNIEKLCIYCVKKKYLPKLDKESNMAIKILNTYYIDKDFEYTRIGYKSIPDVSYIVPMIENLHKNLQSITQNTNIKRFI